MDEYGIAYATVEDTPDHKSVELNVKMVWTLIGDSVEDGKKRAERVLNSMRESISKPKKGTWISRLNKLKKKSPV